MKPWKMAGQVIDTVSLSPYSNQLLNPQTKHEIGKMALCTVPGSVFHQYAPRFTDTLRLCHNQYNVYDLLDRETLLTKSPQIGHLYPGETFMGKKIRRIVMKICYVNNKGFLFSSRQHRLTQKNLFYVKSHWLTWCFLLQPNVTNQNSFSRYNSQRLSERFS